MGNPDELVAQTYTSTKITWVGAPESDASSIYTMDNPFVCLLPNCLTFISYEAINEVPTGILSYPASSCITNPCISWDIDTSVAYEHPNPVTFQIKGSADIGLDLPVFYVSDPIQIFINADSDFSLNLLASDITTADGVFMVTSTRLFEID